MTKMVHLVLGAFAAAALTAATLATPANAAQIFIQQSGTSPAGGDPNIITDLGSFVVGVAGKHTLQNPLLIIVGSYNGMGMPSISFTGGVSKATVGTYGLTAQTANFTSGTAFAALGLSAGGSENFGNWSAADVKAGFTTPTSFTLTAFALNASLTGTSTSSSPITIDESGAANGSFIIAYDCEAGTGSSKGCAKTGDIGETVFTNTGLVDGKPTTPVPEPGSLALLGTALLGLGFFARRRRRG